MNIYRIIAAASLCLTSYTVTAQLPDPTFGFNGQVTASLSGTAKAIAIQPDGKLVTAGMSYTLVGYTFQLFRFNPDGSPDNGFGTGGAVNTEISFLSEARAIAIQPDGKILVGGIYYTGDFVNIYHIAIARYHTDGSLDLSFGVNGLAMPEPGYSDELTDMVLQPDGKILAGGALVDGTSTGLESFLLLRLNSDGTPDNSFGTGGVVTTAINTTSKIVDLSLLPDGKIIAAGNEGLYDPAIPDYMNFALAKYNQHGTIDSSFGVHGLVITDIIPGEPDILQSALVQPDGKILAGGTRGVHHCLARYLPDGSMDATFGTNGLAIRTGEPGTIKLALRNNGKIVSACRLSRDDGGSDFVLNGYLTNGAVDHTFGTNGTVTTDFVSPVPESHNDYAECLLIQPDGKLVAGGSSNGTAALVRYTLDAPTGISLPDREAIALNVYPNPFSDRLTIYWQDPAGSKAEAFLWNISGQSVSATPYLLKNGNNMLEIPNLAPGNYILSITAGHGKNLFKAITKK